MKENNKPLIPDAYKMRVDKISRKYKNESDPPQTNSPCPFCKVEVPEFILDCNYCHNVIPFCIASGKHVITSELTKCPSCNFPAILSEYVSYLSNVNEKKCPMCEDPVDYQLLEKMEDPLDYLKTRKIANMETVEREKRLDTAKSENLN
jgi:WD repeat-containing protein 19